LAGADAVLRNWRRHRQDVRDDGGVIMAAARCSNEVRLLGVVRRRRLALMTTTALQATVMLVLSLPADAQPAPNARPTGGTVVAGAAAISQTASNTAINQSSQRAAVNWQGFNVGSQQSVTFNQPSASSVTLNRVTGPDPSQIAGRIDANGQIVLVNQSGVTFYKGSQVNANGLIATAAGISTPNFMAGVMTFDQAAKPNARIDNQGTITVRQAGLAALVAPQVANSGVINARLGHVVLAGAKTATLDLYGDGLLSLDVTNQVTQTPLDKNGNAATALVTNTGVIVADGGAVQLTARAADGIVANLVQAGGTIRAAGVGAQTGVVALNGVGGSIVVEGQLSAPGLAPGTKGGAVEVATTGNVVVASTAKINASGKAGGGVIAIGTTLDRARGGPSVTPTVVAANTEIQPGAKISANATGKGDGGRVTVLSSQSTTMAGTIDAKGGPSGGNGGLVEVSGGTLSLTGAVDVSAPAGVTGSILLDPLDLFISTENPENGSGQIAPNATGVPAGGLPSATASSWLTPASIANLTGAVTIATTRDLSVLSALTTAQSKITTLTLDAGRNLTVDAGITTNGSILLSAGNITPAGTLTIGSPILSLTGSVFMQAHAGNINQNASVTANGLGQLVSFRTDGTVNFAASKAASGAQIQATAGTIELGPTTDNTLLVDGGFDHDFVALSYRIGQTTNPFTNIPGPKASTINLGATAGAGGALSFTNVATIDLEAHGAITETASSITDLGNGGLTLTGGGGAVTLGAAGNAFSTLGPFTATGNFILANNNALSVTGPVNAGAGDLTIVNASDLTLSGVITANNLFFEVANRQGTGILTLGSSPPVLADAVVQPAVAQSVPATLTATGANGRISLVADNYLVANTKSTITTTAGTVQLAPFTAVNTSLLGGDIAGLIVGADLLNAIHTNGGTLEVGGFTNVPLGATVPAASAATVTIDDAVNLTGIASTLRLDAVGAITEPGGPLTVTTLTGKSGSATLGNT
jgi:filamentous hemagglutinin family protein